MNKSVDNVNFHNININKTWVDVLDFISPKVGDEAIDTWFQPLELEDINKEQATIRVPNKFFGEWLGRNYKDLLIEAFQHAEKIKPNDIIFVLRDQKEKDGSQTVRFSKKESSLPPQSPKVSHWVRPSHPPWPVRSPPRGFQYNTLAGKGGVFKATPP